MLMAIEMFSKAETRVFGISMVAFVLATIFLYLAISGCEKLIRARIEKAKIDERRRINRYEADANEFAEIGNAAIREQRMKSFIAETATGRTIEVLNVEVYEDVSI